MKAIIVDFSSDKHIDIAKRLAERSVEILYWVGKKQSNCLDNNEGKFFLGTIFHDTYDAVAGLPATAMDTSCFEPVSRELLKQLSSYEGQIFSMMTKLNFTGMSLIEKRHHYHRLVWYWQGVLSVMKPDVIIFPDVPHILYNYVLYRVAKILKIKTVLFKRINAIPDRVLFFQDFENYQELKTEYEEVVKSAKISDFVNDYYDKFNKIGSAYQSEQQKRFNGLSGKEKGVEFFPRVSIIIKNLKQMTFLKTTLGYFWSLFHRTDILSLVRSKEWGIFLTAKNIKYRKMCHGFKKEYENLQTRNLDLEQPFIYVPLHRQPEGTTNPMGGVFDDQLLMIDILSKAVPEGWKLYVKEHPTQWKFPLAHLGRFTGYYQTIVKHSNATLIPVKSSGFDLLEKCQAIATVTGTTGMEAVIKGKPALIFGYPVYGDCHGIFKVGSLESSKNAIDQIKNGFIPDKSSVLAFLQAVENIAAGAFIHKRHGIHSAFTYEESVKNIAEGLCKACKM